MRFLVLGPIQLLDGAGRPVDMARRLRTLLAALVLRANQVVDVDDLVEAVWGLAPPRNPRSALQTCVFRLRRAMDPGQEERIRTTETGYLLSVGSEEVDLLRFRSYVGRATGEPDSAHRAELFAKALELWRGEPLSGIAAESSLRYYVPRLTEERLQATEAYYGARLESGEAAGLTAELTELVDRHPEREQFWGSLIRALYRAGRQADALSAYRQLSRHLREELGLTPGPELQHLYRAVLRHDTELSPPDRTGRSPNTMVQVPRQLPADIDRFTGREQELQAIDVMVGTLGERGVVITAVTGPAGIGKSALAIHWAHRNRHRFPDGQVYLNLHGYGPGQPTQPLAAAETLLRSMGIAADRVPLDLDGRSSMLRSLFAGKRVLVVLDNARSADQVRSLLPGSGSVVLITSRHQLRGLVIRNGAHRLILDHLDESDSVNLIKGVIGDPATTEPAAVVELARLCRGLPLALAIAAERATREPNTPLARLVGELQAEHARLASLHSGDEAGADLRSVFSWSYRALSPQAAELFRLLGTSPSSDISGPGAAALAGMSTIETGRLLDQLVDANQVRVKRSGRYEMHDLVRSYARELSVEHDTPAQRIACQRRFIGWLTRSAFSGRPLVQPSETDVIPDQSDDDVEPLEFSTEQQAHDWFDAERQTLIVAIQRAYELGLGRSCWQLAYFVWVHLHVRGAWDEIIETHRFGLRSARRAADRLGEAYMLTGLGVAYRATGMTRLAIECQREAVRLFDGLGNSTGQAAALSNLGAACRDEGRYDEALNHCHRALAIARGPGNQGNVSISQYQLALTMSAAGRPDDAIKFAEASLNGFRRIGHGGGEARALRALAAAHAQAGSHTVAITHHTEAVRLYEQLGDRWYQAVALAELARTLTFAHRDEASRKACDQVRLLLDDLGASGAEELVLRLVLPLPTEAQLRSIGPGASNPETRLRSRNAGLSVALGTGHGSGTGGR